MELKDHGIIAIVIGVALSIAGALLHQDLKGQVCGAPAAASAPVAQ